ncbi:MAG: tRNA (adenosine(37)-N6)-threonylcarbamoyltransferase complex ATPase subunit type 1 TsaE [Candidatus Dormibacteria bacterium]
MSGDRSLDCRAELDTVALGERIGTALVPGDLLVLSGPLGAGKTVLVRGIAEGLGVDPRLVRSPTFVLHHVYRGRQMPLHHIDLYRLGHDADIAFLDLDGLLDGGAVAVEWGELADLRRFDPVHIGIDAAAGDTRTCVLDATAPERLAAAWEARARP